MDGEQVWDRQQCCRWECEITFSVPSRGSAHHHRPPITLNLVFPGLCPWLRLLSPLLSLGHLRVSTVSCSVVWLRRFVLQI